MMIYDRHNDGNGTDAGSSNNNTNILQPDEERLLRLKIAKVQRLMNDHKMRNKRYQQYQKKLDEYKIKLTNHENAIFVLQNKQQKIAETKKREEEMKKRANGLEIKQEQLKKAVKGKKTKATDDLGSPMKRVRSETIVLDGDEQTPTCRASGIEPTRLNTTPLNTKKYKGDAWVSPKRTASPSTPKNDQAPPDSTANYYDALMDEADDPVPQKSDMKPSAKNRQEKTNRGARATKKKPTAKSRPLMQLTIEDVAEERKSFRYSIKFEKPGKGTWPETYTLYASILGEILQELKSHDPFVVLLPWNAAKLEEGGDLAPLRIAEKVDPFAYRTVSSKQVDTVKKEHRASRAKLAVAEEACLIPEEDWANLIKAHASHSRRGRSIGPTPSTGEVLVCEICYHVYTLLEKAHRILAGRDVASSVVVAAAAGVGGCGVSSAGGDTKPASPVSSPSKAKPRTKSTKKSKKSRRQRHPVEDTQRENDKPNVAETKKVGGDSSRSLSSTKPQSHQQTPLPQQHQHRLRGTKRPRLLVADGDNQTILTITKHFRVNNYVMRTASNGKECLDILQSSSAPFDVLLLAKDLPTNDAIDITKWLRCRHSEEKEKREYEEKAGEKRRPKRRDTEPPPLLPQILVMTSELTPLDLRSYVSVGIDGCIRKPLKLKQLTKTVTDAAEYQAKRIEREEKRAEKKRVEAV